MASSATGSGKTIMFGLPLLQRVITGAGAARGGGGTVGMPSSLIIAPTREVSSLVSYCLRAGMYLFEYLKYIRNQCCILLFIHLLLLLSLSLFVILMLLSSCYIKEILITPNEFYSIVSVDVN